MYRGIVQKDRKIRLLNCFLILAENSALLIDEDNVGFGVNVFMKFHKGLALFN